MNTVHDQEMISQELIDNVKIEHIQHNGIDDTQNKFALLKLVQGMLDLQ